MVRDIKIKSKCMDTQPRLDLRPRSPSINVRLAASLDPTDPTLKIEIADFFIKTIILEFF